MTENEKGFTRRLAQFIVHTDAGSIPPSAYEHAKVAFMDWIAVTVAGSDDPLVHKLIAYADMVGGPGQATIVGRGMKKDAAHAALINGAASHALDYDDTLVSFLGHPSVTLFPALLALSEWKGVGGFDFLTAYLIGLQAGGTVGVCAGLDHYTAGWHATSTLGHLASAAACSRLLKLDEQQTVYALGIGGTQSSGLKRVFGTMCKPFHAGRSSQAGLTAALLAKEGFTSAEDILEGPQGFFQAMKGSVNGDVLSLLGLGWDVQNLSQKYHASCHATHSPMDAAMSLVKDNGIGLGEIERIIVRSSQLAVDAAGKSEPGCGLEGKFSITYCVANALLGGRTGTQAFTDERVGRPEARELMGRIRVINDPEMKALEASVEIHTRDGRMFKGYSDILQHIPPLDVKKDRVGKKLFDLCVPVLGEAKTANLTRAVSVLESAGTMRRFADEYLAGA